VPRKYYHVSPARNKPTILKYGLMPRAGKWRPSLPAGGEPHEWSPRVFLATSLMAAFEVANDFRWGNHHGLQTDLLSGFFDHPHTKTETVIVVLDRSKIPGALSRFIDAPVDPGSGMRGRRRRLGTLWTAQRILPAAIIEIVDVPLDLFASAAFCRWMGRSPDRPRGRPRKKQPE
jgi:hypothetical protein